MTGHIYPRFLGVDDGGDFVWELANGRWTWGDDPMDAVNKTRTFTADHYLGKYGPIQTLGTQCQLEPGSEPALISEDALRAAVAEAFEDGKRRGAETVIVADSPTREAGKLAAMERAVKDWAQRERSAWHRYTAGKSRRP